MNANNIFRAVINIKMRLITTKKTDSFLSYSYICARQTHVKYNICPNPIIRIEEVICVILESAVHELMALFISL